MNENANESARRLILASGSQRRRELLGMCGYDFEVRPSEADESGVSADSPSQLVERLSLLKARTVFDALPEEQKNGAVVLGSDTVVVLDGNIIGKPSSEQEAFSMLRAESGRVNHVFTGVAVVRRGEDGGTLLHALSDEAKVRFRELTDEQILAYISSGDPLDKAGAYGIQGVFSMFIEGIEGSYFTVVGLPVHIVFTELEKAGILPSWMNGPEQGSCSR